MVEIKKDNEAIATDDQSVARRTMMAAKFLLPKVRQFKYIYACVCV